MADAVISVNQIQVAGVSHAQRPYAGFTATYDASGVASAPIDKRGYGLVGFKWLIHTTAVTATIQVSEKENGTYIALKDGPTLDLTAAGTDKTDELAEWPFYRIVKNAAEAKVIESVLS